jgi:4-amino-4-deoxy-L-arabinose transferase-like glycosyltransferase
MLALRSPAARTTLALATILAISVALRVGVALALGNTLEETRGGTYDQVSYDALAQRVVDGYGFSFAVDWWPYAKGNQPTAFWSYLYTLFLAAIYAIVGHYPLAARLIQAVVVGVLMPWLVYRIGRRTFGQPVGLIAAGLAAVYFYFVNYGASLMSEAFYIVGILWTLDVSMRLAEATTRPGLSGRTYLLLGLELGLAMATTMLLRQLIVAFLAVLVPWLVLIARSRHHLGATLKALAVAGLVAALAILPFIWRNYQAFGRWGMPNTNAGFTFFWSNHSIYGTRFVPVLPEELGVTYADLIPEELRDLNEADLDRALMGRGLQFVVNEPGRYMMLSLSRIPVYFLFWPTADSTPVSNAARVLSFGIMLPFMLYGVVLAMKRLRDPAWPVSSGHKLSPLSREFTVLFLLFIVSYSLIHLASWANVRYRLPVDALLILFAAHGIYDLVTRLFIARQPALLSTRRHSGL